MNTQIPGFFQEMAPTIARLSVLNRKFASVLDQVRGAVLQKISASDEGYLMLHVFRPGERHLVILTIRAGQGGVVLEEVKPVSQPRPNSFVQLARKYMLNRRIEAAYAIMAPTGLVFEFSKPSGTHPDREILEDGPDAIILDLDARPCRVCLARRTSKVPDRYGHVAENFLQGQDFFESFCEWSLQNTRTKRRPTFDFPVIGYSVLTRNLPEARPEPTSVIKAAMAAKRPHHASQQAVNLQDALSLLPSHVRGAARTRLRFLQRRLERQRADLPPVTAIERQEKMAQGLQASLYMWPKGSPAWYVPPDVIAEYGLAPVYQLEQGEKPGDILARAFRTLEKIKRRREELLARVSASERELNDFQSLLAQVASQVREALVGFSKEEPFSWKNTEQHILASRLRSEDVERLCRMLDVSWSEGLQKRHVLEVEAVRRMPFRSFTASTGEFIRVAKSARDGDVMLKLMPSNHLWIHILVGEGSHVWLEKPKRRKATTQAIREAAILAIHYSRQGKTLGGEVRIAARADIEKKKDLPAGKVLVRRCETVVYRYTMEELRKILSTSQERDVERVEA